MNDFIFVELYVILNPFTKKKTHLKMIPFRAYVNHKPLYGIVMLHNFTLNLNLLPAHNFRNKKFKKISR